MRTRSSARALPRVKLGNRAASTLSLGGFHDRNCPQIRCHRRDNRHIRAAMSCRPAPEGWEWWAFSYIKSCRSPASLCHAGLHFQLCNIFFRSDTEVAVNSTLRPSFCTVATRLPVIRSCSAARAAASSSCRVIHPLRIRHGRNLPVFSCWLLHHPLPAGSPAAH